MVILEYNYVYALPIDGNRHCSSIDKRFMLPQFNIFEAKCMYIRLVCNLIYLNCYFQDVWQISRDLLLLDKQLHS